MDESPSLLTGTFSISPTPHCYPMNLLKQWYACLEWKSLQRLSLAQHVKSNLLQSGPVSHPHVCLPGPTNLCSSLMFCSHLLTTLGFTRLNAYVAYRDRLACTRAGLLHSARPTLPVYQKHTLLLNTYIPSQSFPTCCYSPFGVLSSPSLKVIIFYRETEWVIT